MKALFAVIAAVLGIVLAGAGAAADPDAAAYVCPPCPGCDNHETVYEKAGTCPGCGMRLVPRDETRNVGILLYEGVQIIDYTGPYEVFGQVGRFRVYTVSRTGETITTAMEMSVNPAYSFADAPRPDILVVPGGAAHVAYDDPEVVAWVTERAADAEVVMSVCNGAFILAKAGLLDGKRATTFYGLIDDLREFAPHTEVVTDQRFVDNGKIITSAGLSSGIDASLHVVARLRGEAAARRLALHLEYNWDPRSEFARAALADLHLPRLETPDGAEATLIATAGDRERWERRFTVTGDITSEGLMKSVNEQMAAHEEWRRGDGLWTSTDRDGVAWAFRAEVEPGSDAGTLTVTLRVEKASG